MYSVEHMRMSSVLITTHKKYFITSSRFFFSFVTFVMIRSTEYYFRIFFKWGKRNSALLLMQFVVLSCINFNEIISSVNLNLSLFLDYLDANLVMNIEGQGWIQKFFFMIWVRQTSKPSFTDEASFQ